MAEQPAHPVRVLLLARAGEARQRLEAALLDAGAQLLRAVDPAEGDPAEIIALRPAAVLVALEPAVEDALERYDALLSDPGVLVMFDEADVAARRDGWDAARWVRHLAAKLPGHCDVLPPGAVEDDAVHPVPGALPERAFDPDSVDFGALADVAQDLAAEVPRDDFHEPMADTDDAGSAEADADAVTPSGYDPDSGSGHAFAGLVAAEDMDWSSSEEADGASLAEDPALAELLAATAAARDEDGPVEDVAPGLDDVLSLVETAPREPDTGDIAPARPETAADADAADAGPARDPLSFGDSLSLADDDLPLATRDDRPAVDLEALEVRLQGLSLVDDDAPLATREKGETIDFDAMASRVGGLSLAEPEGHAGESVRGAVLVEAGLGGPDAVRQLLGGLGVGFGRAVLVRLQLDGGRYERLVQQMQRASALPVVLAEPGAVAESGRVYFLPPDIGLARESSGLRFVGPETGSVDAYDALPADDSALLFLSGAGTARVERAMELAAAGALVLAQAPESCYDGAAASALVGRGAPSAEPGDLAQALIDRWS